jgi:hypothetical protein
MRATVNTQFDEYVGAFRKVARNARQLLLTVTDQPLVGSFSPFTTSPGNALGDYFLGYVQSLLRVAQAPTSLQLRFEAARNLSKSIFNVGLFGDSIRADARIFLVMLVNAMQNLANNVQYCDISFIDDLLAFVDNETVTMGINAHFATVRGNFTSREAIIRFFNTQPVSLQDDVTIKDQGDRLTLTAFAHQLTVASYFFAEYQRLYAYNRGLVNYSFQAGGRRSVFQILHDISNVCNGILQTPGLAPVKAVVPVGSASSLLEAVIAVSPKGLSGLPTVRSAVQWCFIVAFWVFTAGFWYVCRETKLL